MAAPEPPQGPGQGLQSVSDLLGHQPGLQGKLPTISPSVNPVKTILSDISQGATAPFVGGFHAARALLAEPNVGILPLSGQEDDLKQAEELPGVMREDEEPQEALKEIGTAATFGALTGGVLAKTPAAVGLAAKGVGKTVRGGVHIANSVIDRIPGGPEVRESTQKFVSTAYRNLWDRGFTSGQELLRKIGLDPLRIQLGISRSVAALMGGKYVANSNRGFKGLTADEVNQVTHLMETVDFTAPKPLVPTGFTDRVVTAARGEANRLREFGEVLQKAGVQVYDSESGFHSFVLRKNYVPHRFVNPDIYRPEGEFRDATITQVMKKLDMTKDRATEWVDAFAERLQAEQAGILADRPISFGTSHFLQGRNLELPGYETDLRKILPQYYEYGSRRWANHVMFGPITPELQAMQKASEQLEMFSKEAPPTKMPPPPKSEQLFIEDFQQVRGRGIPPTKIEKELSPQQVVQERLIAAQKELRAARSIEQRYPRAFAQLEQVQDESSKEIARRLLTRQLGAMETDQLGRKTQSLLSTAARAEVITKLALGAIAQPSQMLSAVVRTGYKGAFTNFWKTVSGDPEALDFALRSGVILKGIVRHAEESLTGKAGTDFLEKVFFTQMDMKSRVFGALQGASFAQHQARLLRQLSALPRTAGNLAKMARVESKLATLGLDTAQIVQRGGHLTEDELLLAAQKVSTEVNFWGDSLSLPEFYRSPYGRYITMFKSFGFQQGKLFKDTIAKPAAEWLQSNGVKGDIGPLTRFAVITPLGGEIISDLKKWARGKKRTTNDVERVLENIANAAGFGLAADAMEATKYGIGGVLGWGVGPIATDVGKVVHNLGQASRGEPRSLAKQTIETLIPTAIGLANPRLAPIVAAMAPAISNTLLPPKEAK